MTALQRRFHVASERSAELEREMNAAYDTLHDTLSREQKTLLLRLVSMPVSPSSAYTSTSSQSSLDEMNLV